jgi:hypothetical protein
MPQANRKIRIKGWVHSTNLKMITKWLFDLSKEYKLVYEIDPLFYSTLNSLVDSVLSLKALTDSPQY